MPQVRFLGADAGVVSYVWLTQTIDSDGKLRTTTFEETRVWQRENGEWRRVHFHRCAN